MLNRLTASKKSRNKATHLSLVTSQAISEEKMDVENTMQSNDYRKLTYFPPPSCKRNLLPNMNNKLIGLVSNNDSSDCDSGIDSSSSVNQRFSLGGDRASSSSSSTITDEDVMRMVRSSVPSSNGPIKGDHRIVIDQHRFNIKNACETKTVERPNSALPQACSLTSLPNSCDALPPRVRFDDGLHLSEQSIRSSCRKLFSKFPMNGYVPARNSNANTNSVPPSSYCTMRTREDNRRCRSEVDVTKATYRRPNRYTGPHPPSSRRSIIVKKSNSCQNLERNDVVKDEKNQCLIYSKDMINVYAQLASVVPQSQIQRDDGVKKEELKCGDAIIRRTSAVSSDCMKPSNAQFGSIKRASSIGCRPSRNSYAGTRFHDITTERDRIPPTPPVVCSSVTIGNRSANVQLASKNVHSQGKKCDDSGHRSMIASPCPPQISKNVTEPVLYKMRPCFSHPGISQQDHAESEHVPANNCENINCSELDIFRRQTKKRNLLLKFQVFKNSAKSAVLRAFSTEKTEVPKSKEISRGSSGIIGTIRNSIRRKKRDPRKVNETKNKVVHGHILHFFPNGSQEVEIENCADQLPLFSVAKAKHNNGVLVTRLKCAVTKQQLTGLLDIGDQILEIENISASKLSLNNINNVISQNTKLKLKIMPSMYIKNM